MYKPEKASKSCCAIILFIIMLVLGLACVFFGVWAHKGLVSTTGAESFLIAVFNSTGLLAGSVWICGALIVLTLRLVQNTYDV